MIETILQLVIQFFAILFGGSVLAVVFTILFGERWIQS